MTPPFPNRLSALRQLAIDMDVLDVASHVLDHPRFATWSGADKPDRHHYGEGGLQQHTWEVVILCLANRQTLLDQGVIDGRDLPVKPVYLAALFHDIGKTLDYQRVDDPMTNTVSWTHTPHKTLVRHITRSGIEWVKAGEKHGLDQEAIDAVLHAILAHHGQPNWGSPVSPSTRLAWLLHLCDQLSARMYDCETVRLGWTSSTS